MIISIFNKHFYVSKFIQSYLLFFVIFNIILYLLGAFIFVELNPINWNFYGRIVFAGIDIVGNYWYLALLEINNEYYYQDYKK